MQSRGNGCYFVEKIKEINYHTILRAAKQKIDKNSAVPLSRSPGWILGNGAERVSI
jgi:hypothetical protein